MLLLGIDFETTGLEPTKDVIIECGAVLWDTETQQPLKIYDEFVHDPASPGISEEIIEITGIRPSFVEQLGVHVEQMLRDIEELSAHAEAFVAHNGTTFDKMFLEQTCKRQSFDAPLHTWIDTTIDVPYPEKMTTRKLVHLAAEHGFLNPFAHRAVFDVLSMLRVLSLYDIKQVLALAKIPTIQVRALVSYEDREKAKARGYRWNSEKKMWWKSLKENQLATEAQEAGFKVSVLA